MADYWIHNDGSYPGEPGPSDEPEFVEPRLFQGNWRDCLAAALDRRDNQCSEGCFFITGNEIPEYYRVVGSFVRKDWAIQDSYEEQIAFDKKFSI